MRDLFGSTNYIEFGVLETILSSSNAVNKLLHFEENMDLFERRYTFEDYISNLDSYLYGVSILPDIELSIIKKYVNNYINYLYIPLIELDNLYIVKSRFIKEIINLKNNKSKINDKYKDFILLEIYMKLNNVVKINGDGLRTILSKLISDEFFLEYLTIYYDIYNDKSFIKNLYFNNKELKGVLEEKFNFISEL